MDYSIKIEDGFTTSVFYTFVLKELHNCLAINSKHRVIFDLTRTKYIDALVVPNLLCVGYILKKSTGKTPIIATIDHSIYASNSTILRYLRDIGFLYQCEKYNLFEIYGLEEKKKNTIPEYNTTYCFDYNEKKQISKEEMAKIITSRSNKLFNLYLRDFFDEDKIFGYGNIFAKFGAELCHNANYHGESFAYMTIQSNIARQSVSVAVSDCGHGYSNALYNKYNNDKEEHPPYTITKSEFLKRNNIASQDLSLLSLIECTFYRYFDEDYGLWNIAKIVLSNGGLIRIHSSDSRIILTPKSFGFISLFTNAEQLREYLLKEFINGKNYKYHTGLKYRGVHIEIEMPMKTKGGYRV